MSFRRYYRDRRRLVSLIVSIGIGVAACLGAERPNILWLSVEDISPHLGCYGDALATTPNLDRFAGEGVLYRNAFVCAGVCAPSRSTIITGMYQTSIGTHHMRCRAELPDHIRPFTTWLREAGYYCTNNSKEDYQFQTPAGTWDESSGRAHWKNRPRADQPFFAVFNYGGCHESGIANDSKYRSVVEGLKRHDRDVVAGTLPPYYPDTPVTREDWGRYYDVITAMDRWVGEQLKALEDAGLADNTLVFFWSDHGVGLPRGKRWLYDSGMRVPLIVRVPEAWREAVYSPSPGTVTDQLVSLIDLGPTMLRVAGLSAPEHMQGQAFLGAGSPVPRQYVFGARDRMDERYDVIRAVCDGRFKYIRNYEPLKPYYQYMNTPEKGRTMRAIRGAEAEARKTPGPMPKGGVFEFLTERKPVEEFYDLGADPHEMENLVGMPEYQADLERLRQEHLTWVVATGDLGLIPEAEITARQKRLGSAWAILSGSNSGDLVERLRRMASLALEGPEVLEDLRAGLGDSDAAVRYWAASGLGNLGVEAQPAEAALRDALEDASENVRVAAARALCRMDRCTDAFPVLESVLDTGSQWARLHAAIVLDDMDGEALPLLEVMKLNKAYRDGMVARGKYTVRVLNRALNELLGTSDVVD